MRKAVYTEVVHLRLTPEQHKALMEACANLHEQPSILARRAVTEYLRWLDGDCPQVGLDGADAGA